MKQQNFSPPDHSALGPEVPDWFLRYMEPVHNHIRLMTTALQGNLTFLENSNADVVSFQATHDSSLKVSHSVKGNRVGAVLAFSAVFDYPDFVWRPVREGRAEVKIKWATDPGSPQRVDILFFAL